VDRDALEVLAGGDGVDRLPLSGLLTVHGPGCARSLVTSGLGDGGAGGFGRGHRSACHSSASSLRLAGDPLEGCQPSPAAPAPRAARRSARQVRMVRVTDGEVAASVEGLLVRALRPRGPGVLAVVRRCLRCLLPWTEH
jgi:hypothetical protein